MVSKRASMAFTDILHSDGSSKMVSIRPTEPLLATLDRRFFVTFNNPTTPPPFPPPFPLLLEIVVVVAVVVVAEAAIGSDVVLVATDDVRMGDKDVGDEFVDEVIAAL